MSLSHEMHFNCFFVIHLRVIVQLHYFSLRQVVDGQSQRVVEQQVANADALRGKILIELELCKLQ
jgi:hypothetical protein